MVVFSLCVSGVAKHDGSLKPDPHGSLEVDVNMPGEEQAWLIPFFPWFCPWKVCLSEEPVYMEFMAGVELGKENK